MFMPPEIDALNLYTVTVRILSDRPTFPIDAVFLHNRSYGDDTGLIEIASGMIETRQARFVAVTNNEGERFSSNIPYEANPGKTYYINKLLENNVPEDAIIVPDRFVVNMRQENTAFIELARQRRWTTAAVLTQPHQLLGAMLGAVQEMNQTGYFMRLYAIAPNPTSWQEVVKGSQGREQKPRAEHIEDEFKGRILLRQETGELATLIEILEYLDARDRGSLRLAH